MSDPRPLDESQIKALIARRMQNATGGTSAGGNNWINERRKALDYYFGAPLGNEADGFSQVVSRDVAEVVDAAMPSLMRVFFGGEEIVKCLPKGQDDDEKASQSNDYVNHVLNTKNQGFSLIYDWIKDGLIGRLGVAKVYWQEEDAPAMQVYQGLDPDEAAYLQANEVQPGIFEVAKPASGGYVKIEGFPVEELWFSATARSVETAQIIAHGRVITRSEVREMGYDIPDNAQTTTERREDTFYEGFVRDRGDFLLEDNGDPSMERVHFFDGFTRMDKDGSGIARLYRIVFLGRNCQELLACEPADHINIIAWSPVRVPHRMVGKSLADDVMDVQEVKTVALRGAVDGLALMNNPRRYVKVSAIGSMNDLIENKIGQVIRVTEQDAVKTESQPESLSGGLSLTEYMDSVRQDRTGIRPVSTLNSDAINAYSQTARGAELANDAANDRLELIARTFAEMAMVPLVKAILRLGRDKETQEVLASINDEPRTLDPRNFDPDLDVQVKVGLGAGDRRAQVAKADGLFALAQQIVTMQGGLNGPFITKEKAYNIIAEAIKARGYKNVHAFLEKPEDDEMAEPEAPPPDPAMLEMQAKAQLSQAELQMKSQMQAQELQLKQEIAAADREAKSQETAQRLQQEYDIAMAKIEAETQAKARQIDAEISLKLKQMDAEIALKRELARMGQAEGNDSDLGNVQFGGEPG